MEPFNPNPNPTLETETAGIRDCLKAGDSARWRAGFHYRRIADGSFWKTNPKCRNLAAWGKAEFGAGASTLREDAAVCRAFEEVIALKYDFSNLVLFIAWANATKLVPMPADPGDTLLAVPGKQGLVNKKFSECVSREIKAATRALKPPKKDELPPEAAERMTRYRTALKDVIPEGAPFPIKATVEKGAAKYAVIALEPERFDQVIRALSGAWAPVPLTPTRNIDRAEATVEAQVKVITDALDPAKGEAARKQMDEAFENLRQQAAKLSPPAVQPPSA